VPVPGLEELVAQLPDGKTEPDANVLAEVPELPDENDTAEPDRSCPAVAAWASRLPLKVPHLTS